LNIDEFGWTSKGDDRDIEGTVVTRLKCEYGRHKAGISVRDFGSADWGSI
jgi:hypothetical protein